MIQNGGSMKKKIIVASVAIFIVLLIALFFVLRLSKKDTRVLNVDCICNTYEESGYNKVAAGEFVTLLMSEDDTFAKGVFTSSESSDETSLLVSLLDLMGTDDLLGAKYANNIEQMCFFHRQGRGNINCIGIQYDSAIDIERLFRTIDKELGDITSTSSGGRGSNGSIEYVLYHFPNLGFYFGFYIQDDFLFFYYAAPVDSSNEADRAWTKTEVERICESIGIPYSTDD